jgi:hypothetical protein
MATRSSITAKISDGTFKSIYCHFDGYVDGVGKTLIDNYNTQEKVDALVLHGDMSSISESCEKPVGHSYETPVPGYNVYYGRDRGDKNTEARSGTTAAEALGVNEQEYDYFWDGAQWAVQRHGVAAMLVHDALALQDED